MIGKIFPKISTRGFYDLKTGKTLKISHMIFIQRQVLKKSLKNLKLLS